MTREELAAVTALRRTNPKLSIDQALKRVHEAQAENHHLRRPFRAAPKR